MDYKMLIEHTRNMGKYAKEVLYETSVEEALVASADAIETLLAERNAAIGMLHGQCYACKHNDGWHNVGKCGRCIHETARFPKKEERQIDNWEWRGPAIECKEGEAK